MAELTLRYRRAQGVLSSGDIVLQEEDRETVLSNFAMLDFEQMMAAFSVNLNLHPEATAHIQRTDRPGLLSYPLDARTTELLRKDPDAAVKSMTYEAPPSVQKPVPKAPPSVPAPVFVVGHDTIADVFGDHLYTRLRTREETDNAAEIECPGCGRWVLSTALRFSCHKCGMSMPITCRQRWALIDTAALLATSTKFQRFFFPRRWNRGRNWVSRKELSDLYENYKQEKKSCTE